ncbi:RlpA-like double-psi beta-barrel-protein domain-containing protein-containing protein [Immersiella caudata]|uniref:cellulase n=1 Tax=Immersiella caudata TaxID=314043 RepID=A0AA40CDV5_9PEZI|nr:RlpA-like double-psi beta-barrel-protein domain-containing protein-containing protein [Immersiella caudata]
MRFQALLTVAGLGSLPLGHAISGKSYTGWDCCKPGCAWPGNLGRGVQGVPKVCDVNNNPLGSALNIQSGCQSGTGYLCDLYVPTPVSDSLSYGFATMPAANCCKCFQLTWKSGNANGKQMVVQVVNNFEAGSNGLTNNDIVILTPGGGNGPNELGCRSQYGRNWGQSNGGVANSADCANLPQNLQGGCYWRYNWARGAINSWNIDYQQVACPARLTSISGCSA